jgi:hypothetical protein
VSGNEHGENQMVAATATFYVIMVEWGLWGGVGPVVGGVHPRTVGRHNHGPGAVKVGRRRMVSGYVDRGGRSETYWWAVSIVSVAVKSSQTKFK